MVNPNSPQDNRTEIATSFNEPIQPPNTTEMLLGGQPLTTPEAAAMTDGYWRGRTSYLGSELIQQTQRAAILEDQVKDLEYIANHDPLTGLLNKNAWKQDVETRMSRDEPLGIMVLDMDAFKAVNDAIGHIAGDELLKDFSTSMQKRFQRRSDALTHERLFHETERTANNTLSRWGGDEFATTVDLSDRDHDANDEHRGETDRRTPKTMEERMQAEREFMQTFINDFVTEQPQQIRDLGFNVSIGSAHWDPIRDASLSPSDLFRVADEAMYAAKQANKNR